MRRKLLAALMWAAAGSSSLAQLAPADPDWKEADAPAPPALKVQGLIPLELERSDLRWGVDPSSISVGADGIVRYVVVATSVDGAVNAFYEGVRCSTSEVKVYARHNPATGWTPARDADWRPLRASLRHSGAIASGGVCQGRAPNGPASRIVRELGATPGWWNSR